jgi:hypothetical protein
MKWERPDPRFDRYHRYPHPDMLREIERDTMEKKAFRTMMVVQVMWKLLTHLEEIRGKTHFRDLDLSHIQTWGDETNCARAINRVREELANTYRAVSAKLTNMGLSVSQDWWGSTTNSYKDEPNEADPDGYVYRKPGRLVDVDFLLKEIDGVPTDILYAKSEEWAH